LGPIDRSQTLLYLEHSSVS